MKKHGTKCILRVTIVAFMVLLSGYPVLSQTTKVVLLGSGNPNPDPQHSGPAVAIIVDQSAYLVDFGTGIVRQAAALSSRYNGPFESLDAKNLKIAFLTHLHSDHTIGLPDLIFTPWIMGREDPLKLFGPEGLAPMVNHVLEAYQEDIKYRLYSNQPATLNGWKVLATEIPGEGVVYMDSLVKVEAFPVTHGSWPQCFGYRFTTEDRVVVISGDARPSEKLIEYALNADVLVHEVYYKKGWDNYDEFWQAYHSDNHTSTFELGEIAKRATPSLIITYHTLYWGGSDEDILNEIKGIYDGEVIIGEDLGIY